MRIMFSGHFDPFHDGHLIYIEQALQMGDNFICIVSSDRQLMMKKGKVNIPEQGRRRILELILGGLCYESEDKSAHTYVNIWDAKTTLVAEALRYWEPDIFCRGGDKTIADMPADELEVCQKLGIKVVHARNTGTQHGSTIT